MRKSNHKAAGILACTTLLFSPASGYSDVSWFSLEESINDISIYQEQGDEEFEKIEYLPYEEPVTESTPVEQYSFEEYEYPIAEATPQASDESGLEEEETEYELQAIESGQYWCEVSNNPCSFAAIEDQQACAVGEEIAQNDEVTLDECRARCTDLEEKIKAAKDASPCQAGCEFLYPGRENYRRRRNCVIACKAAISQTMRNLCRICARKFPGDIPMPAAPGSKTRLFEIYLHSTGARAYTAPPPVPVTSLSSTFFVLRTPTTRGKGFLDFAEKLCGLFICRAFAHWPTP